MVSRFDQLCLLLCAVMVSVTASAEAGTVYVRDGASGGGTSWSDAVDDLPSTMNASDLYYVAGGSYRSGSIAGRVLRATTSNHGTDTGWLDTYDGQAVFSAPLRFDADETLFDGSTWHGFEIMADDVTGGCAGCGSLRIAGDDVTLRNIFVVGDYSGGFGHSVGLVGRNPTLERCHFFKTYYEDTFGGEPTGTFTIRESVIEMPNPPNDGSHRDVFNPYTNSTAWNLVLEDNIFHDIWLFGFLMQDSTRMGDITVRGNVFSEGGAWAIRFGSGNAGANDILIEHNTFYNVIDFAGPSATHRNNIYARAGDWTDIWGGDDVHASGSATDSLFWIDPTDFLDPSNALGADGIPRTADDGFRLRAGSEAIGTASDGSDVGAYQYLSAPLRPSAPTGLSVN